MHKNDVFNLFTGRQKFNQSFSTVLKKRLSKNNILILRSMEHIMHTNELPPLVTKYRNSKLAEMYV